MITYLKQLENRAAQLDLDLAKVCECEGVAATTLARWRKGETACHQDTAKKLFARMDMMAAAARAA